MNKFNAGDKVKIVKRVLQEEGWENGWGDMDRFIGDGRIYTVRHHGNRGYFLKGYADPHEFDFGWPHGALRKVEYDLFDI